jgi:acyl dehydratase
LPIAGCLLPNGFVDQSLITDELRAHIDRPMPERRITITSDLVRRVRETLAGGPVEDNGSVPPSLIFTLEDDRGPLLPGLPESSLLAGDEWEWRRAFRLGETLTARTRLAGINERLGGRLGQALFLRYECVIAGSDGAPAAFARRSTAYFANESAQPVEEPSADTALPLPEPPAGVAPERAAEGGPLSARIVTPTLSQVVRYCGASWNFVPFFYDSDAARAAGLPGTLIPGPLKLSFLTDMVLAWAGPGAFLESIRAAYRRPDVPGRPLLLAGAVTSVSDDGSARRLGCELWIENSFGARSVVGAATVRWAMP